MRLLRRLLCAMFDHPRGMIFTGAGGWFCPACVRDMDPLPPNDNSSSHPKEPK